MERLLLVDGSNLLFQMFYGMPARITAPDGHAVHGTLGFVGALLRAARMLAATHVLVVFDGEHENKRCALDEDYKANRPDFSAMPVEETPFSQLPDIYSALTHLEIKYLETTDCEADDLIAAYALALSSEAEIVILSLDSDYFQLVSDTVRVLRYRGAHSQLCDVAYVRERFGVSPAQYADFKALTGDASDNIRGVRGIGPKTAAGLLREFGTLDALLERSAEIRRPSVRAAVSDSAPRLCRNRALIRLSGGSALPFALDELVFEDKKMATGEVLHAVGLR